MKLEHIVTHAWPGGYPMYYVTDRGMLLCPHCAKSEPDEIVGGGANYEDDTMTCEDCEKPIESAYEDPELQS
jgi:hypothetical protein